MKNIRQNTSGHSAGRLPALVTALILIGLAGMPRLSALDFHGPAGSGPGNSGGSLNFPGTYGITNGAIAQSLGGNGVNLAGHLQFHPLFLVAADRDPPNQ